MSIFVARARGVDLTSDPLQALHRFSARASRGAARFIPTRRLAMQNKHPLISFTFDDVPDTAFTNGARILDQYGVKGTFYVAPGILGQREDHWRVIDRDQLAALAAAGHEIGCHTYSHVKVQSLSAEEMAEQNRLSIRDLEEICGKQPFANFAYPYGVVSFSRKLQLGGKFSSCRGIYPGINSGMIDLDLLLSVEIYDRTLSRERIRQLYDDVERMNGWLIFYTHDVADPPSWIGCSTGLIEDAVREAKRRGIACVSVAEGLAAIGA